MRSEIEYHLAREAQEKAAAGRCTDARARCAHFQLANHHKLEGLALLCGLDIQPDKAA